MAKKVIKFNLPVLIAFFVYSYAKLRMLEFYYDFLDRILPRTAFEMVEMDTGWIIMNTSIVLSRRLDTICNKVVIPDSLYFACSHKSLEDAVPESRKPLFNQIKSQFLALCPDPNHPDYDYRTPGEYFFIFFLVIYPIS